MLKCQVIIDAMEKIAPKRLAESWDNPGLLVGSGSREVSKVYVCLDVTEETAERAIANGCELIVAHHPLIFRAIKNLRADLPQGRLIEKLIRAGVSVYAAHTNLDIATGGVNDVLAEKIGLKNVAPFAVTQSEELNKIAVYVPKEHAQAVRSAMTKAGAGHIGNYSDCTFFVEGTGTFRPLEGTSPYIGSTGELEFVDEVRIETIAPVSMTKKIVSAMIKAHPYEEVAYDIFPLKNEGKSESLGRLGELSEPMTIDEFAAKVKASLNADALRFVRAGERMIKKVALCSGAGAEFIGKAAFMGADAYVTGDVKYHEAQSAKDAGIHLIDAGHFPTEFPVVAALAEKLKGELKNCKGSVEIIADSASRDIFETVK